MPGRRDDAIAQYEAALRLNPDSAEVQNNLGHAWSQIPGRLDDAIAQYEEALRLQPDFAEAHNNLGVACDLHEMLARAGTEHNLDVDLLAIGY